MEYNKDTMDVGKSAMATLGITKMAYIRPVTGESEKSYAVCAADGTQLAVFASYDAAFFTARQYDLNPVNLH